MSAEDETTNPNKYTVAVEYVSDSEGVYSFNVKLTHTAGSDKLGLLSVRLSCAAATSGEASGNSGAVVNYDADTDVISITMDKLGAPLAVGTDGLVIATLAVKAANFPEITVPDDDEGLTGATNPGYQDEAKLTVTVPKEPKKSSAPAFDADYATLDNSAKTVTLTLKAVPAAGTEFKVYDAATDGNLIYSGAAVTSGEPSVTTFTINFGESAPTAAANYYISAKTGNLAESTRVPVSVFVYNDTTKTLSLIFPDGSFSETASGYAAQYNGFAMLSVKAKTDVTAGKPFEVTLDDGADTCKVFLMDSNHAPVCKNLIWKMPSA